MHGVQMGNHNNNYHFNNGEIKTMHHLTESMGILVYFLHNNFKELTNDTVGNPVVQVTFKLHIKNDHQLTH